MASPLFRIALLAVCCALVLPACGDDDAGATAEPSAPAGDTWPDRADSTRALMNPPEVDYRLYVDDVAIALEGGELSVAIDWTNGGPGAAAGSHALIMQVTGPVNRTLRVGALALDGLAPGGSTTTTLTRAFPPDITAGGYGVSLQVQRETAPNGPLDLALRERFFLADRFFEAGNLVVPE